MLVHTAFVLVMIVAKNVLWELNSPWWKIGRVFRFIELPALWAVDPTIQRLPLIPEWAAFGRMTAASSVSEFIAYALFGGAFYTVVVSAIAYARQRRCTAIVEAPRWRDN
jgi:hypothetical protein